MKTLCLILGLCLLAKAIYFWANTGTTNASNSDDYNIIEGRDYTNAVKSGYTPLTYPHPYASQ